MSSHLNWLIIRKNHSYLHKCKNIKKPFSSEPGNLKNVHTFNSNGLVHKKTIDIAPRKKGPGIALTFKKTKRLNKPAKTYETKQIKGTNRKIYKTVRNFIKCNQYRKELLTTAIRRTSAILLSQQMHLAVNKKRFKKNTRGRPRSAKARKAARGQQAKRAE